MVTVELMHIYATSFIRRYRNLARYSTEILQITVTLQGILRINTPLPGEISAKGKKDVSVDTMDHFTECFQYDFYIHCFGICTAKIWNEDIAILTFLFRNCSQVQFLCPKAENQQLLLTSLLPQHDQDDAKKPNSYWIFTS